MLLVGNKKVEKKRGSSATSGNYVFMLEFTREEESRLFFAGTVLGVTIDNRSCLSSLFLGVEFTPKEEDKSQFS